MWTHFTVLFTLSLFCSTGEFLSLAAMDTFLRSVQPEVNDLFVLSLVLVNLLSWMDLFITQVCHGLHNNTHNLVFTMYILKKYTNILACVVIIWLNKHRN